MPSNLRALFKRKGIEKKSTNPIKASTSDLDGGSTASHSSGDGGNFQQQQQTQQSREPCPEQHLHVTNISKQGKFCDTKSREGVPIITSSGADYFTPSAVSSKSNYATDGFYSKSKLQFGGKERPKVRPSARTSAFGGAPRYDWMDIETTAAIKVQAAYRRLRVQNDLDRRGLSTPGMRNRRAQRRAQQRGRHASTNADVPFPFNLCGIGLLFGDGTLEDEKIVAKLEKKKLEKKKLEHVKEDEEKRKFRMRKKESQHLEEGIEVVESFDDDDEDENVGDLNSLSR